MKDREFDQLFKDRLEDAEVQPSANLWDKLEKELKPRRKRVFPIYWIAAAVAVIVLSVVLMVPDREKIRLQGTVATVNVESSSVEGSHDSLYADSKAVADIETKTYESTPLIIAPRLNEATAEKEFTAVQRKVAASRPVVKQSDSSRVVKKPTSLPGIVDQDVVIAKADVHDEINANVIKEVDYVAAKADRRAYKFLKFDTDNDESSLVGINLGFIRLNLKRDK
ncbi:hypothetical protein [Pedobacter nyackensis]|uniref:Uncharacterized protein n=1 Tax=Pedobacter nyackensis TaxID=475255 RepID=A0A1W2D255_9SPHI|nr:hypothetical protein [Pedobacter nyackensis]SMC91541.1 hypothetical protein SAMN04488101_105192 [Pedobacter nyackensis]